MDPKHRDCTLKYHPGKRQFYFHLTRIMFIWILYYKSGIACTFPPFGLSIAIFLLLLFFSRPPHEPLFYETSGIKKWETWKNFNLIKIRVFFLYTFVYIRWAWNSYILIFCAYFSHYELKNLITTHFRQIFRIWKESCNQNPTQCIRVNGIVMDYLFKKISLSFMEKMLRTMYIIFKFWNI